MVEKACKKCKRITTKRKCPTCGSQELSMHWVGLLIILDPDKSEIAKEMKIEMPGRYALKVR